MPNIIAVEIKPAKNGKPFKTAQMDGEVMGRNKFNIFTFHTRYDDVLVGRAFALEEFERDGEYIRLRDPDAGIKGKRGGGNVGIAMAQENKARHIALAQDNKDHAIRLSGSMNHAVTIVSTFNKDLTPEDIQTKIINWRNWFLENWETEKDNEAPY